MPMRPLAWIAAVFFLLLLVGDVIFGVSAASGSVGDDWIIWGPVLAVVGSWIIAMLGGIFSIYILRIVKFLTLLYVVAAVVLGIVAITQARWDVLIAAIIVGIVSVFVGGLLVNFDRAAVNASIERKLNGMRF